MLKILLDMDGVLCNWEKRCCELFKVNWDVVRQEWIPGDFYIEKALTKVLRDKKKIGEDEEITTDDIWKLVDAEKEKFWANLEEYPWSKLLYEECLSIAPTYFVTTPSWHPTSLSGKLIWMQEFTGEKGFRNYMVGPKKYLCSRPGNILIDDNDKNIDEFEAVPGGGRGVVFPRWNNKSYRYSGNPMEYALVKIREYKMELGL